jgi:hypothetical protein
VDQVILQSEAKLPDCEVGCPLIRPRSHDPIQQKTYGAGAVEYLSDTLNKHCSRRAPRGRTLKRLDALFIAILLTACISTSAAAFDCLAYKPEGARGQWHAEVVAGKICWYGANWRSFLPKKVRVEGSTAPSKKHVEPSGIPEQPAEPAAVPGEATAVKPQDLQGLRQATATEAAALINAISLDFDPAPPTVSDPAQPKRARHGMTEMTIIIGALASSGLAFAMIIRKRRKHRARQQVSFDANAEQQTLERVAVNPALAPPLQPGAVEEHQLVAVPSWLSRARPDS